MGNLENAYLAEALDKGFVTEETPVQIDLRDDMAEIFIDMMKLFSAKSKDYTNSNGAVFEDSGLIGQHLKLTDKVKKLRKTMWDAEIVREARALGVTADNGDLLELQFEDTEEILMDIVGHCALAISILRKREQKRVAENREKRRKLEEFMEAEPVSQIGLF